MGLVWGYRRVLLAVGVCSGDRSGGVGGCSAAVVATCMPGDDGEEDLPPPPSPERLEVERRRI